MAIRTDHSVEKGLYRLLRGPQDVPAAHLVPWREPAIRREQTGAPHQALFDEYKEWLEAAVGIAIERWEGMIQVRKDRGVATDAAREELYDRSLAGPAASPQLMWAVHEYWLRCDALNREVRPDERVPPQVFLLGWVVDEGGHDEWVQILTAMPYWPVGLNEKGEWV